MNELENRRLMLQLKNNIDMRMYVFLKYDLELNMRENANNFSFYNKGRDKNNSKIIDFQFSIFYEDSFDIYHRNYMKLDRTLLTEEELDKLDEEISNNAEKESDLNYVVIYWLGVNTKGEGVGSELMKVFIEEVKKIEKIKYIFLEPKNKDAKRFWNKVGFVDDNECDKRIELSGFERMVLNLKAYNSKLGATDKTFILN